MLKLAADRDRLAASSDEVRRTVEIVWSAYRSVLSHDQLAYLSTAITSGRRMWAAAFSFGFKGPEELKAKAPDVLRDTVILPNIVAGTTAARHIATTTKAPVVAPAIFEARGQRWTQDEYMALWLRMIEENVGTIYMAPDWEYSNGGAEEYLHAVQMALGFRSRFDIVPMSTTGEVILPHTGADLIGKALLWIHERGGRAPVLVQVYRSLVTLLMVHHSPDVMHDLPALANPVIRNGLSNSVETLGDCKRLIELDYGYSGFHTGIDLVRGIPRSSDATPEDVGLKAEDPSAPG